MSTLMASPPDVFLGGGCGKSVWRQTVAIPRLTAAGVTYYDPQVAEGQWYPGLIEIEAVAKNSAPQLIIVIGGESRGGASCLEACEYVCYGTFVHLVIDMVREGEIIGGVPMTGEDLKDANRMREYLRSLVTRRRPHLRVWPTVNAAVSATIRLAHEMYGVGSGDSSWVTDGGVRVWSCQSCGQETVLDTPCAICQVDA